MRQQRSLLKQHTEYICTLLVNLIIPRMGLPCPRASAQCVEFSFNANFRIQAESLFVAGNGLGNLRQRFMSHALDFEGGWLPSGF